MVKLVKVSHSRFDKLILTVGENCEYPIKGITKKREKVWLENWIRDSKKLIDSGDPIAIRIYNDYNQSPMLPYNLTDIEMAKLLEYLSEK